ncbi:hypothetical protein VTL71DRAFT_10172 [Oculimacula yallundae]|uniref:Uncharacterized protein n=1 Tax=Oculimacula yallundae TaxID=86028 RepID=A0ABR4BPT9_9HELO
MSWTGTGHFENLEAVIALLRDADQMLDRLSQLQNIEHKPPRSEHPAQAPKSDAAIELTYIYDVLKATMLHINKIEEDQTVNLQSVIDLINLVPDLFAFQDETITGYAVHTAQLAAAQRKIEMFEETTQSVNEAARKAREVLAPETATDPAYTANDFITHAVRAVSMLNTKIEQQMNFNRSTPNEQHAQLETMQAENTALKVQMQTAEPIYAKAMKEIDRLRLVIETETINSRTPENKRRHAVYNNLEAVFHEANEVIFSIEMMLPDFNLPTWVTDLYNIEYRDGNDLPTVEEIEGLSLKLHLIVEWAQGEGWPGWQASTIESSLLSKEDEIGLVLYPLMERIAHVLQEVDLHSREVWTNSDEQGPADSTSKPKGCTCVPERPGTFTVPGTPCSVCSTLSPLSPASDVELQPRRWRLRDDWKSNNPDRKRPQDIEIRDRQSESTKPQLADNTWNSLKSPRSPWARYSPRKDSTSYTSGLDSPANRELSAMASKLEGIHLRNGSPRSVPFPKTSHPLSFGKWNLNSPFGFSDRPDDVDKWTKYHSPRSIQFPTSPATTNESFTSPAPDNTPIAENALYWRSGNDLASTQLWVKIEGLQEGLQAYDINVTKYPTLRYLETGDIDAIMPELWGKGSIFQAQLGATTLQASSLELIAWNGNVGVLGEWRNSAYNPENRPPKQDKGKGRAPDVGYLI